MLGIKSRRLGRFFVPHTFFHKMCDGEGANLFHGMIILRAEAPYDRDGVEYLAHHPDFDEVRDGCMVRYYDATFDPGAIYPRWH